MRTNINVIICHFPVSLGREARGKRCCWGNRRKCEIIINIVIAIAVTFVMRGKWGNSSEEREEKEGGSLLPRRELRSWWGTPLWRWRPKLNTWVSTWMADGVSASTFVKSPREWSGQQCRFVGCCPISGDQTEVFAVCMPAPSTRCCCTEPQYGQRNWTPPVEQRSYASTAKTGGEPNLPGLPYG